MEPLSVHCGQSPAGAARDRRAHAAARRPAVGATSYYYGDDQQDTEQAYVDASTLTLTLRREDPFGNARGAVPAWPNSRGFVGGTSEPDGFVFLGARLYDPVAGRFISDDPITNTDEPQAANG
jgi:RHS repeat-associated protein